MKIRWSIVFLALFGVVAAVAAAVLTASLSAQGIQAAGPAAPREVTILVAAHDLRAMETIRQEDLVAKTVPEKSAPESHYSDPAQVVGRVLSLPVIAGQAFARNSFPADGSGLLLAAHLPLGKRAVTLSLDDHSGLERIIYPGCIVDVVASFKMNASEDMGRAVSMTLLQNIEVLAVENSTVVNKEDAEQQEAHSTRSGTRRSLLVTVMVDSKQAEALQLGVQQGNISLAMRNPADVAVANSDATLLAEGQLAQLAKILAPKVGGQGDRFEEEAHIQTAADGTQPAAALEPLAEKETVAAAAPGDSAPKGSGPWGIEVFRAMAKETTFIPVQN